jgi:hypothetical protein
MFRAVTFRCVIALASLLTACDNSISPSESVLTQHNDNFLRDTAEMDGDDPMDGMLGVSRAIRRRTRSRPEQSML